MSHDSIYVPLNTLSTCLSHCWLTCIITPRSFSSCTYIISSFSISYVHFGLFSFLYVCVCVYVCNAYFSIFISNINIHACNAHICVCRCKKKNSVHTSFQFVTKKVTLKHMSRQQWTFIAGVINFITIVVK